jgi:hypothetical protein
MSWFDFCAEYDYCLGSVRIDRFGKYWAAEEIALSVFRDNSYSFNGGCLYSWHIEWLELFLKKEWFK